MKKILISGPIEGHEAQRAKIIEVVQRCGFSPTAYEYKDENDGFFSYRGLVNATDAVVCYFGDTLKPGPYDSDFNENRLSWTELECYLAKRQGTPVLAFHLSLPTGSNRAEVETKDFARTQFFREKMNAQNPVKSIPFDSLDSLGFEVVLSLRGLFPSSRAENSSDASNGSKNIHVEQVLEEQKIPLHFVSQIIQIELARVQEQIQHSNSIDPETKAQVKSEIEKVLFALTDLFERLERPNRDDSEAWGKEFSKELRTSISNICTAKNVASITVPTTLILGCGALGAILGGSVGFGAGSVFGHLISGQMKPGAATKQLEETFNRNEG